MKTGQSLSRRGVCRVAFAAAVAGVVGCGEDAAVTPSLSLGDTLSDDVSEGDTSGGTDDVGAEDSADGGEPDAGDVGADEDTANPPDVDTDLGPDVAPECAVAQDCPPVSPCHAVACDAGQCVVSNQEDGVACSDGDACSVGDHCSAGTCVSGAPKDCATLDGPCAAGVCDPAVGGCAKVAKPLGTACDDANAATVGDRCTASGSCAGVPASCVNDAGCADTNPCTVETCVEGACVVDVVPAGAACDDAQFCTSGETCDNGVCAGGAPTVCPATGDTCSVAVCKADQCTTVDAAEGLACDDGSATTSGDRCVSGACTGVPASCASDASCDDQNPCTADVCSGGTCSNTATAAACSDGDPCTVGDHCAAGVCVAPPMECDDGVACTADACVAGACESTPVNALCDDGLFCDGGEVCVLGTGCTPGAPPCPTGSCDETQGACTIVDPTAADELAFQAALALYDARQYVDARAAFQAFVADFPASLRRDNAAYLAARSAFELGDFAAAEAELSQFPATFPSSALLDDVAYFLGRAQVEQAEWSQAIATFSAFVVAYPDSPWLLYARYWRGRAWLARGMNAVPPSATDFGAARADFDVLIADTTATLRDAALYYAGRTEYEWGRLDGTPGSTHLAQAEQLLGQAVAQYPSASTVDNARYYHGMTAWQRQQYAQAIPRFQQLRAASPSSIYVDGSWYYEGRCQYALGAWAAARTALESLLAAYPAPNGYRDGAHYYAGRAAYSLATAGGTATDFDAAIGHFDALVAESPSSGYADNALYFAGRAHHRLAGSLGVTPAVHYAQAIAAYQQVHQLYAGSGYADNAWRYEVEAYVDQGLCVEASGVLSAFAAAFPASPELPKAQTAAAGC